MKKRLVWRIVIASIWLAILSGIILYAIAYYFTPTVNPVGAILTTIACTIIGLGIAFLYLGNLKVDEEFILWEKERLSVSYFRHEVMTYPFHLDKPSIISGTVSGTIGPYTYFITDFFGTLEETIDFSNRFEEQFAIRPKKYAEGKGPGKTTDEQNAIGPISLPQGNYALRFGRHTGSIDATFSLKKTVPKKPYKNLYAFGLTLLEVGVPVLITGVISLGFGTLVS